MKKTLVQKFEESMDMTVPDEGIIRFRQSRDVDESPELPTMDENPRHKEAFNRLLGAAVRGKKSDDQT